MAAINQLGNNQSNLIWRTAINDHSSILQSKIVRWDGTSYFAESSITNAIGNASSGDTIFLKSGVFTEKIELDKAGITIIGEGSGTWNGTTCVGGTQLKGVIDGNPGFVWKDAALNCTLKDVALVAPTNLTELSFFGSTGNPVFNCKVENVSWYGNGANVHNVEFRGKNWYVKNVKSYNAGSHNFAIKAADSTFRNIFIDPVANSSATSIIIKSHVAGNYGSPKNIIIDGWKVIISGSTNDKAGMFIENHNAANEVTDNIMIKNGYVENSGSGSIYAVHIKGQNQTGNIIKNISIDNCVFKGCITGVLFGDGYHDVSGKGIDGVVIRNCTFLDPLGSLAAARTGVNNSVTSPAKNVTVSNVYGIGYVDDKLVHAAATATSSESAFTGDGSTDPATNAVIVQNITSLNRV